MYDVVIIGAGVCGAAAAMELSKYKGQFLVIEKEEDVCCGTSKANSAIVHAGYDAPEGSLMAQLNVEGNRMIHELSEQLEFPFRETGSLVIRMEDEDHTKLEALFQRGKANGVEDLRIIGREELHSMEKNLSSQAAEALYAPTGGIVCPFEMNLAFAENAAENDVQFKFCTKVTGAVQIEDGWCIHTDEGDIETHTVINAAGVYADTLHNLVSSCPISITPRRGSYYLLDSSVGDYVKRPIFQLPGVKGKGILVTPTVHGNLMAGPTARDLEEKEAVNTTAEELQEITEKLVPMLPGIPLGKVITSFAGLRAKSSSKDFIISEAKGAPGWIDMAGMASPGLTSAPAAGKMAVRQVESRLRLKPNPDYTACRKGIIRPLELSEDEYFRLIAIDSAYANMVCRCELVTEGEIVAAIHRTIGARSVDGVKRRTRAGMGRCQGGFCQGKVMEILSRELGVPQTTLTKCGGVSYLLAGETRKGEL